jgi:glucose/arabinose dehydrogenase
MLVSCSAALSLAPSDTGAALPIYKLKVPTGFHIALYTSKLPGARSMTLSDRGTLYVGTRDQGVVYAIPDATKETVAGKIYVIARGLHLPNGVAFRNGSLYIAEVSRVTRLDSIESKLADPPEPVVVNDSFPNNDWHGWKFIRFGPDGKLYVPVGMPCNVCLQDDKRFGTIMRMNPDGTGLEIFASGVRNSVGFDWNPVRKELWFTDNGRDNMGDNMPPDELNYAPKIGMNFGFPYCHGKNNPDPEFGKLRSCDEFTPPIVELGPHVASLGMRFYTGAMFPKEYRNQIFIAEHGSWNRSIPIGDRVTLVRVANDTSASNEEIFAEGWMQNGKYWGRPVDVQVMPDGALLVSDDLAGAIYRISYKK